MAKNKGKRNRSQRNSGSSSTLAGVGSISNANQDPGDHEPDAPASDPGPRSSVISIDPTPSSDNVIPFPRSSQLAVEGRDTKATLIAGTGSFATPRASVETLPSEVAKPVADSALRSVAGEQERTTIPPEEATGERAKASPERPVEVATRPPGKVPEPAADRQTEKPGKVADDATRNTLRGEVVGKKDEPKRGHKESLSTHLSDEAKAFFSEAAAVAAYKQTHDTFEDLAPAAEDHAAEFARSKRAMTITGVLLVGVIAVVVGFGIYSRTSVPETGLDHRSSSAELAPPVAIPPPPVAEPAPAPPVVAPAAAPVAVAVAVPTPVGPADGAVAAAPAMEPVGVPTPTPPAAEPTPTPPIPVAAPSGRTPQQLLAAARSFRGPFAGRLAAFNAYFDANPTDDRTMTTYAMSLAESAHHAEAEAVANRAVTANPRSGQAWFVLAYARSQQRNREGTAEARTRCIALGGTWATECRAVH